MSLTKDEVVKMAREAGFIIGRSVTTGEPNSPERFATLCRAPLVAEVERLKQAHEINADTLNAMQVEIDDWKARALKAEQAGEPVAWNHGCNALCMNIDLWVDHCPHCGKPRPAAPVPQEQTSAVPVVEQLVEALKDAQRAFSPAIHVGVSSAIAAGQQYLKEIGK